MTLLLQQFSELGNSGVVCKLKGASVEGWE